MKFVSYMPASGEIFTWGDVPSPEPHVDGAKVLEGVDATTWTHYVANGALVAYTAAQATAKAARPDYDAAWSNTAMVWQDLRPLEAAQAAQLDVLADAYGQAILAPITFTTAAGVTQTYQADPDSVANATASMLGCQAALSVPSGYYWVALDNTHVPFTYADLQGLAAAMFQQGHVMFDKLQQLKAQVRAATTVAAVVAVVW